MADERLDYVNGYVHEIDYALADGEGFILRKVRQRLSELSLSPEQSLTVDFHDEAVIQSVIDLDTIAGYLITDDETQPLANWWWHLGKVRNKTYPADLLPNALRDVYLNA